MKKIIIYLVTIFIQTAFLAGMVYQKERILIDGHPIILKVEPRDPKDMFRGDYVTLNYDISTLSNTIFDEKITSGMVNSRPVYVVLEKSGNSWIAREVLKDKPGSGDFIKANMLNDWHLDGSEVMMEYGLDSFFVPEHTGTKWEDLAREGNLYVQIKVDNNGEAIIENLISRSDLE